MELLAHMIILIFWRTFIQVFIVVALIYSPTNNPPLPTLVLSVFLRITILVGIRQFLLWFWSAFSWWLVILNVFSCTSWPSLCLLWKKFSSKKIHFTAFNLTYNPWPTLFCKVVSGVFLNWQLRYSQSVSSVTQSCLTLWDPMDCPSSAPGACWNSCPSSWWCHPTILSSVVPFSSCPQSLPASGSFPVSQFFTWGGQTPGVSASASVLPMYLLKIVIIIQKIVCWSNTVSPLHVNLQVTNFQRCEHVFTCPII